MGGQKRVSLLGRCVASLPNPHGGLFEGESGTPGVLHGERHAVVGVRDHDGRGDHVHLQERGQLQPQHDRIGARGWVGVIGNTVGLPNPLQCFWGERRTADVHTRRFVYCTTSAQSLSRMFFHYRRNVSSVGGCGISL